MDTKLERMLSAIDEAFEMCGDLQRENANNPLMLQFHRHIWIVRHSLSAARAASLDVAGDASDLRSKGVTI